VALEAEMKGQYFRNCKPIVGVALVTLVLPNLFSKLGEAPALGSNLLGKTVWVALALLRSVIVLADWQAVQAYLWEYPRLLPHLLHIMASIWPLLCYIAG
jgi:hypothetical protein